MTDWKRDDHFRQALAHLVRCEAERKLWGSYLHVSPETGYVHQTRNPQPDPGDACWIIPNKGLTKAWAMRKWAALKKLYAEHPDQATGRKPRHA